MNWTINATGAEDQLRTLDANFSSSYGSVASNNTEDAYVCIGSGCVGGGDSESPTFSNMHTNVTNNTAVNSGAVISFGAQWSDNEELSMYVNSSKINNSGGWSNGTWTSFAAGNWSNFTIAFPASFTPVQESELIHPPITKILFW